MIGRPRTSFRIARPAVIRALASPIRQDIVDLIEASGPLSIAALSALLARPADSLYYHVRTLCRLGLLVPVPASRRDEGGGARYDVPGADMRLEYVPHDPRNAAAVQQVVAGTLRAATRTFRRAFEPRTAVTRGPRRNLWAARAKGWLDEGDLAEVNRLLERLVALMRRGNRARRERRTLHEITFVLTRVPEARRRKSR